MGRARTARDGFAHEKVAQRAGYPIRAFYLVTGAVFESLSMSVGGAMPEHEVSMETDHLLDDIREVNLSYLLLMQRLINTDREAAMFRLKIDDEMADLLSRIPVSELARLARCNQLLCHFSLRDADQLHSLIRAIGDDNMRQVHAAILLGSNERRAANGRRQGDRRQPGDRRLHDQGPADGVERRAGERRDGADRRQTQRRATDRGEEDDDDDKHDGNRQTDRGRG